MTDTAPLFRGVNLVLTVIVDDTTYILGCVEGSDIDLGYEGGAESSYGTRIKRIGKGSKKASLTITRWYYADEGQEDLLLDLFKNEDVFDVEGYLIDKDGTQISDTTIKIIGVQMMNWKPRTGGAEDVLGEEGRALAVDWDFTDFKSTSP
jgi:hypothetical protein